MKLKSNIKKIEIAFNCCFFCWLAHLQGGIDGGYCLFCLKEGGLLIFGG